MAQTDRNQNLLGGRLKALMAQQRLSSADLARMAGVKTSFLYDILNGKSLNPSPTRLASVARALNIDLPHLLGCEDTENGLPQPARLIAPLLLNRSGADHTKKPWDEHTTPGDHGFTPDCLKRYSYAPHECLRLFRIEGDSMEPALFAHDTVLVDLSSRTPSPPGLFLIWEDGRPTAKRIERLPNSRSKRLRVISDNPRYTTYERSFDEAPIIGRIVWLGRAM